MQANYVQRIRLVYSKMGNTRYIGHLDLARTLERAINRAGIPIAHTQGYNKRPRMQLADALPLGFTSECEIVDLWLSEMVVPQEAEERLGSEMPPGLELKSIAEVALSEPALQNQAGKAIYRAKIGERLPQDELQQRLEELLEQPALLRERRGKRYDLRPRVFSLTVAEQDGDEQVITMELSLSPGDVGRPDEVLKALDLDPLAADIHRTQISLADG
jgi:radical SAM-linked protein